MKNITVKKTVILVLILNLLLAAIKLIFGILGHSVSLTNDGINSVIDFILSIVLIITIKVSNKKPDKNHPYGHEKFEGILSFFIGLLVVGTGIFLLIDTIKRLVMLNEVFKPQTYTLIIAIFSVIVKVFLFIFTKKVSIKHNQASLKADSVNHFADAIASSVVVIGIFISILGFSKYDYVASVIIALVIIYSGIKLTFEATSWLVDKAPSKKQVDSIKAYIKAMKGVKGIDDLKIRMHVTKLYVDVEIIVNNKLSLIEAHKIAEHVHIGVEKRFDEVIHCMVHVNPEK